MTRTTAQRLAAWADRARQATDRRNELIRQMRDEGATLRQIAAAAGVSHVSVAKILAR